MSGAAQSVRFDGHWLRSQRTEVGFSREKLAKKLRVPKYIVGNLETKPDRIVPPDLVAKIELIRDVALDAGAAPQLQHGDTWKRSASFDGHNPPFTKLPNRGVACGCGRSNCSLYAWKYGTWPDGTEYWRFKASRCGTFINLDSAGKLVTAPPPRYGHLRVPRARCAGCGRLRDLMSKWSSRLGCMTFTRYCRSTRDDTADLKHDPPVKYWQKDGRIERVPVAALRALQHRAQHALQVPACDLAGCAGNGIRMEGAARRAKGAVLVFRCRAGQKHHYLFLHRDTGLRAFKRTHGLYSYKSADGKFVEINSRKRRAPIVSCPEHGLALTPYGEPRARRWSWNCPDPSCTRWYGTSQRDLTKKKASRWKTRGRKKGMLSSTLDRIRLAAAFTRCRVSQNKMSPYIYPDTSSTAYKNTRDLFHLRRREIAAASKGMKASEAEQIVQSAGFQAPSN